MPTKPVLKACSYLDLVGRCWNFQKLGPHEVLGVDDGLQVLYLFLS